MDLDRYLGKVVRINLLDGYHYVGTVEKVEDGFISLIDIKGKWVTVNSKNISLIREVDT